MTRNKKYEIVFEKKAKSFTNHTVCVSVLRYNRKLNVEITINNGVDDYADSIRLHQEEFLEIFDNDIGFDPNKSPKSHGFWNLNYGRARTLKFIADKDTMIFEVSYNGYRAKYLKSDIEDLEAIWKLVHNSVLKEFNKLANKQRFN